MSAPGCKHCWHSADAKAAWKAVTSAEITTRPFDDHGFIVNLRQCAHCGQRYLQISREFESPDYEESTFRTVTPISEAEHSQLTAGTPSVAQVEAIADGQPRLHHYWPASMADAVIYWRP